MALKFPEFYTKLLYNMGTLKASLASNNLSDYIYSKHGSKLSFMCHKKTRDACRHVMYNCVSVFALPETGGLNTCLAFVNMDISSYPDMEYVCVKSLISEKY
jgi:hypothetical protein